MKRQGYYIQIGRRKHWFNTLDEARTIANEIFSRTGIVVGIVATV